MIIVTTLINYKMLVYSFKLKDSLKRINNERCKQKKINN